MTQVWLSIVAQNLGPTLVLEDDVDMEADFVETVSNAVRTLSSAAPDWSLLWVGHCFEDMVEHDASTKVGHRCALYLCTEANLSQVCFVLLH